MAGTLPRCPAMLFLSPSVPNELVWGVRGFFTICSLSIGFIGALILSRFSKHRVGWLFTILGLLTASLALIQEYGYYAVFTRPELAPAGALAAWLWNWLWVPGAPLFTMILLYFPDGKLPSPRWRVFIWLGVANAVLRTITVALRPGPLFSIISIDNPFGLASAAAIFETAFLITGAGSAVFLSGAAWSLLQRYRQALGSERQQIKWFTYAVGLVALISPTATLDFPWHLPASLAFIFIPAAAGIAIFRYRLYDIDILIRRTLVYSILSVLMVTIYLGTVVLFQNLLQTLTGQGSQLSIVASTLTIAALFNPLRLRVQGFINSRFYRRAYHAEKTLAAFAATATQEVDLDTLAWALQLVIQETLQPDQVSVWLARRTITKPESSPSEPGWSP